MKQFAGLLVGLILGLLVGAAPYTRAQSQELNIGTAIGFTGLYIWEKAKYGPNTAVTAASLLAKCSTNKNAQGYLEQAGRQYVAAQDKPGILAAVDVVLKCGGEVRR